MNRKISRNEKQKCSNEEKLAIGEEESALINGWQQHFSIVAKLVNKQSLIYHLKMF